MRSAGEGPYGTLLPLIQRRPQEAAFPHSSGLRGAVLVQLVADISATFRLHPHNLLRSAKIRTFNAASSVIGNGVRGGGVRAWSLPLSPDSRDAAPRTRASG